MRGVFFSSLWGFKVGMRKRVFWVLLGFGVLLLFLTFVLTEITFSQKERVILDSGKVLMLVFSIFYVLFLGSHWCSEDSEEGKLEILLSKPLTRGRVLLGKFIGDLMLLGVLLSLMTFALQIVLLLYAKAYTLTPIYYCVALFFEASLLLAFTFFVGTLSTPFLAFISGVTFFIAGNSLDILTRSLLKANPLVKVIMKFIIFLWPDFTLYDLDQHLLFGVAPFTLTLFLLLYTLGYASLFLATTSIFWKKKDL